MGASAICVVAMLRRHVASLAWDLNRVSVNFSIMLCEWFAFGVNKPTLSYFFIPLVLGPLNSLVWWEVPLGDIALGCFLFLQEQIKDIIIIYFWCESVKWMVWIFKVWVWTFKQMVWIKHDVWIGLSYVNTTKKVWNTCNLWIPIKWCE